MTFPFQILLGVIIVLLVVWLIWRLWSRRTSIPCPSWLGWMVEMENPFAKNHSADKIIDHLELRPGMSVLDAGCGPGRVTIPLARALGPEGEVVATDIQPQMLQRAQAKAKEAGLTNVHFRESAIDAGKLEAAHFDRVVLVTVLGVIPDQQAAIRDHRACTQAERNSLGFRNRLRPALSKQAISDPACTSREFPRESFLW